MQAMTQTVEEWVRLISTKSLPVMQRTLTLVRDLLNKKTSVNHARLSEAISRDPGFSLHVMRQLSALPNQPKEPITRISLAIPMLGMELIEKASQSLPCLEDRLKGPPRRGMIGCYSRAAHAASYARGLAELRNQADADSLYTSALLHDIGEMVIWSESPDTMLRIQQRVMAGDDWESVAKEVLGFTFEELNIHLSEHWQLPELIRASQGLANSYQAKPLTIMLASTLARDSSLGWSYSKTLEDFELLAEFLEIPVEQSISCLHRLSSEAARSLQTLSLPLPAFFIICGDPQVSKPSQKQASKPAAPKAKAHRQRKSTPQPVETAKTAVRKSTNPLQELLQNVLEQMHHELGLSRAMFAMLTPDRKMLRSRLVVESEQQLSLKDFALDTTKPSLFKLLLNKPQAISLNKSSAEKYLPMIPQAAKEQINTSGFVSMSIFIRNKPIGLFYADNGLSGPGVTRHQYENFKALCQNMMQTMSVS
jgi:HD-like signal output (HDOD) protein